MSPLSGVYLDVAVVAASNINCFGGGFGVDRFSKVVVERFALRYLDFQAPATCRSAAGLVESFIPDLPAVSSSGGVGGLLRNAD